MLKDFAKLEKKCENMAGCACFSLFFPTYFVNIFGKQQP